MANTDTTRIMSTRGARRRRSRVGQVRYANHEKKTTTRARQRAPGAPGAIRPAMNSAPSATGADQRGRWCIHTRGTALRRSTSRRSRPAPGVNRESPAGSGRSSSCSGEVIVARFPFIRVQRDAPSRLPGRFTCVSAAGGGHARVGDPCQSAETSGPHHVGEAHVSEAGTGRRREACGTTRRSKTGEWPIPSREEAELVGRTLSQDTAAWERAPSPVPRSPHPPVFRCPGLGARRVKYLLHSVSDRLISADRPHHGARTSHRDEPSGGCQLPCPNPQSS